MSSHIRRAMPYLSRLESNSHCLTQPAPLEEQDAEMFVSSVYIRIIFSLFITGPFANKKSEPSTQQRGDLIGTSVRTLICMRACV